MMVRLLAVAAAVVALLCAIPSNAYNIREFGWAMVTHEWQTVYFDTRISSPVVFANPATDNEPDQVVVQIRNVVTGSFEIRLKEASNDDGVHIPERVNWVVWRSETVTRDGYRHTVNRFTLGGTTTSWSNIFTRIGISNVHGVNQVCMVQLQTLNGKDEFLHIRLRNVNTNGFDAAMETEYRAREIPHGTNEVVGYICTIPYSRSIEYGKRIQWYRTSNSVQGSNSPSTWTLSYFSSTHRLSVGVAKMLTRDTSEPGHVRMDPITSVNQMRIWIEEDESQGTSNSPTSHTTEEVALMGVSCGSTDCPERITCTLPIDIANADRTCSRSVYALGTTCTYSCLPGYTDTNGGTNTATCNDYSSYEGRWSGVGVTCTVNIDLSFTSPVSLTVGQQSSPLVVSTSGVDNEAVITAVSLSTSIVRNRDILVYQSDPATESWRVAIEPIATGTATIQLTVTGQFGHSRTRTLTANVQPRSIFSGIPANVTFFPSPTYVLSGISASGGTGALTLSAFSDDTSKLVIQSFTESGGQYTVTMRAVVETGQTTVTFRSVDITGAATVTSMLVILDVDITPPVRDTACPGNSSYGTDDGVSNATLALVQGLPSATDEDGVVYFCTREGTESSTFALGANKVTETCTDDAGNSDVCVYYIIVYDDEAPERVTACPGNTTVPTDPGEDHTVFVFTAQQIDATDNVDGTVTCEHNGIPQDGVFPYGTTTLTVECIDAAGNSDAGSCVYFINVIDTEAPVLTYCPTEVFRPLDKPGSSGLSTASWAPVTATDNVDGELTAAGSTSATLTLGSHEYSYTITDSSGNSVTCTFNVTIVDDETAPSLTSCPSDITVIVDAPGVDGLATVSWDAATAVDAIDGPTTSTDNSGTFSVGTNEVVRTLSDTSGNGVNCTFNVIVEADTVSPVLVDCADQDFIVDAPGSDNEATITWRLPSAIDAVDGVINATGVNTGTFAVGSYRQTYELADTSGNSVTCTFNVTINADTVPPVLNCPTEVSQVVDEPAELGQAFVTFSLPTAEDAVDGPVTVTGDPTSGTFSVGRHPVTYTANDTSGNEASCTFDIVVRDDILPPTINDCPEDIVQYVPVGIGEAQVCWSRPASVSDNVDSDLEIVLESARLPGSFFPVGTTTVTYSSTDTNGQTGTCEFTVTVLEDDNAPDILHCPADITLPSPQAAMWEDVVAYDHVDGLLTAPSSATHTSGSTFSASSTQVSIVFTDSSANSATCSFNVFVTQDSTPPVITNCPSSVKKITNGSSVAVTWENVVAVDERDGPLASPTTESHSSGDSFSTGTTSVNLVFADSAGNEATCTFDVVVFGAVEDCAQTLAF